MLQANLSRVQLKVEMLPQEILYLSNACFKLSFIIVYDNEVIDVAHIALHA